MNRGRLIRQRFSLVIVALVTLLPVGCHRPSSSAPAASANRQPTATASVAAPRSVEHRWAGSVLKDVGGAVVGTVLVLHEGDRATLRLPPGTRAVTLRVRAVPSKSGRWPRLRAECGACPSSDVEVKPTPPPSIPAERLGRVSLNDAIAASWPTTEVTQRGGFSSTSASSIKWSIIGDGSEAASTAAIVIEQAVSTGAEIASPGPSHKPGRVVIIGIDGLGVDLLDRIVASRQLPTFERLMAQGAHGPLWSEAPTQSPAVWNTIATGKEREKHGILDFTVDSPRGPVPVNATYRRVATLWEMFQSIGRRTTVVNWWTTWPAQALRPDSLVVSDAYVRDATVDRGVYPERARALLPVGHVASAKRYLERLPFYGREFGSPRQDARYTTDWRVTSNLSDLYAFAQEDNDVAADAAAVAGRPADLVALYFRGFDPAAHFFGEYSDPVAFSRRGESLPSPELNVLPTYLRMLDALLAGVLRANRVDLSRDTVLLLSDHGSAVPTLYPTRGYRLNALFRELGWLDWLYGRDSSWDPERTAVFSGDAPLPEGNYYAEVHENLKTKKFAAFGLPEADAGRRSTVLSILKGLKTQTGKPLFTMVTSAGTTEASRDVLGTVYFNTAVSGNDVLEYNARAIPLQPYVYDQKTHAEHSDRGFFILAGPQVCAGRFESVRIVDVVPTLLALQGMPIARDLDGRVAEELFTRDGPREYLWIDSYDAAIRRQVGHDFTPPDKEYLDRLRSLGYLR